MCVCARGGTRQREAFSEPERAQEECGERQRENEVGGREGRERMGDEKEGGKEEERKMSGARKGAQRERDSETKRDTWRDKEEWLRPTDLTETEINRV